MDKNHIAGIVGTVAGEAVRQRQAGELERHWGDAILIQALARVSAELEAEDALECAGAWMDEKLSVLDLRQPAWEWGYLPVAAVEVAERSGATVSVSTKALEIVEHIMSTAKRSSGVMVTHEGRPQVWVDSMFFSLPALFTASQATGDSRYGDDARRQLGGYISLLMDTATSFFTHCWDEEFQGPARYVDGHFEPLDEAPRWARGNAWALLTLVAAAEKDEREDYADHVSRLAAAVLACQDESGGWHTVLTDKTTYLETSASAMFALAFIRGIKIGILGEEYFENADRAWRWLQEFIRLRSLTGVSAGTPPGAVADYQRIPVGSETFGTGFFLLLGLELLDRSRLPPPRVSRRY